MDFVAVGDVDLEVEVLGSGEPVILIQTALVADQLKPVAERLSLGERYRLIRFHRRGYGNSSPAEGGSILRDADDCRGLLTCLGIDRAHIVGVSFSAAIVLWHDELGEVLAMALPIAQLS